TYIVFVVLEKIIGQQTVFQNNRKWGE
ncbi:DUF4029 domain-containing protein, partial [Bacillus toyonensis]